MYAKWTDFDQIIHLFYFNGECLSKIVVSSKIIVFIYISA